MSDTPRTDVAQHNMGSVAQPHYVVDVEVAHDLERELAEAKAEIVRLKGEAQYGATFVQRAIDAERELAEAVAKERERCALVCERKIDAPAGFYQIVMAAAAKIRKGE